MLTEVGLDQQSSDPQPQLLDCLEIKKVSVCFHNLCNKAQNIMPLSGIWNELKKESACKMFELRGTEDIWGIYCTASDNISDPDFSQKCKGKTESELKKALRLRCKQLMASDHGNIEIQGHILSLKECGGPRRPFENGHFLVLPQWCCARLVFWRGVPLARAA